MEFCRQDGLNDLRFNRRNNCTLDQSLPGLLKRIKRVLTVVLCKPNLNGILAISEVSNPGCLVHPAFFARLYHQLDQVQAVQVAHDALVRVPYNFFAPIISDHPPPSNTSGQFVIDSLNGKESDNGD